MNLKPVLYSVIIVLLAAEAVQGQRTDLVAIHRGADEITSHDLYTREGAVFTRNPAFKARNADLNKNYPHLTVSGDFNGDGVDEIAFFEDLEYTPNTNPDFARAGVVVYRSNGEKLIPSGAWHSAPDTAFSFAHVDFSVAYDFNKDGYDDIALFYNDHSSDQLAIYVLESDGFSFGEARSWYSCDRLEFNFTAVKFALSGDFNGNALGDIAVFYNYFGATPDTPQAIFLFESQGDRFELLPAVYNETKAVYDFSEMRSALAGNFNMDTCSDIAVLMHDAVGTDVIFPVFEGSAADQLSPVVYRNLNSTELDLDEVFQAVSGEFAGDEATDLALFYNNPGSGDQEVLVLENEQASFLGPVVGFSTSPDSMHVSDLHAVVSGSFACNVLVSAATWMDDKKGALSFTFDDGYRGAFEHGGAELDAAGLKGTFYIFTDTTAVYDGELASTSLIREYKDNGHEIASHTANHADLGRLTESGETDSIHQVLSSSLELLNQRFDQYTMSMSIPYGSFQLETLGYIADHFYSARSSQHGFNLATPYDFYALKSWPVVSTTSPAFVDELFSTAEKFGTYLPLMYHDMVDEPFDEDVHIYTYSRELFRETVLAAGARDLWVDTHERIYKYIRERNALRIHVSENSEMDPEDGSFYFTADDGLSDSIYDMAVTLKINLPGSWNGDTVTVGPEDAYNYLEVQQEGSDRFVLFNWLPVSDLPIHVNDGIRYATGRPEKELSVARIKLKAFPNPFQRETRIQVTGTNAGDLHLIIRDIHGRIVMESGEIHGDSFLLSRASLNPGIYIAQLIWKGQALAALKLLAL